jgi:transposase InsO family protein
MGYKGAMPWKESVAMDERVQMVCAYQSGQAKSDLAFAYGVSRKTIYKWLNRFKHESWDGLRERARAPHAHPNASDPEIVRRIVELRAEHPFWGAPKLRQKLLEAYGPERTPAESTVSAILKRHGLTRPAGRIARATPSSAPLRHVTAANQLWTIDVKGQFYLGNRARCYPLTLCDAHSRYLLGCRAYTCMPGIDLAQAAMKDVFRQHGLPETIRSDNGSPFASTGLGGLTELSVWWLRLGIGLERIEPAHPEQNGRHERMHRTLKEATANPPRKNLKEQQRAFDEFQSEYNEQRPHEALGQQAPTRRYERSARAYPEKLPEQRGYPENWPTCRPNRDGLVRFGGHQFRISCALADQYVGFCPVGEKLWAINFEGMNLGLFDQRNGKVQPWPTGSEKEPPEDYNI